MPFAGLEQEMDRLLTSVFSDFVGDRIPVDLYEDSDHTYVRAELPGVNRSDIQVELVDGYLNIEAVRTVQGPSGEERYTLRRSITVPDAAVDADKIQAAYENGILTVTLPKREESKPRKVSVTVK